MASNGLILITGGTGQQGLAAVRALGARGRKVRVLTRDLSSTKAKAASASGAELVRGDVSDRDSLHMAMEGVEGVFCVPPLISPTGPDGAPLLDMYEFQLRGVINVVDAAVAAQVDHFILSSVSSAEKGLSLNKNVHNKWLMEEYIRATSLRASFLRLVSFMDNFFLPLWGVQQGVFTTGLAPNIKQPLIATEDIGAFVALMIERPHESGARIFEIAGDELDAMEMASVLSRSLGRRIPYLQLSIDALLRVSEDAGKGYARINAGEMSPIDIDAVRAFHPGVLTFEAWLAAGAAERLKELLPRPGGMLMALPAWRLDAIAN